MKYDNNIRRMRDARSEFLGRSVTQQELADAAGLSKGFVSLLESGQRQLVQETAQKIAAALNCQVKDLFGDSQPSQAQKRDHDSSLKFMGGQKEPSTITLTLVRVLGRAETDQYTRTSGGEGGEMDKAIGEVPYVNLGHRITDLFALDIADKSVDRQFPLGSYVVFVNRDGADLSPEMLNGKWVALRKWEGRAYSWEVRRVEYHNDILTFHPDSTEKDAAGADEFAAWTPSGSDRYEIVGVAEYSGKRL